MSSEPTTSELRVVFSGLCLYVVPDQRNKVGILMPDARKTTKPVHDDGEIGEPHVGYVRFDAANLAGSAGDDTPRDPTSNSGNGLVYKFDGHELNFGFPESSEAMTVDLNVPDFREFATALTRRKDLWEGKPAGLLMRTVITGGGIVGKPSGTIRELSSVLSPKDKTKSYSGSFAGFTTWTRPLDSDSLTVTITSFDGKEKTTIPLKAVGPKGGKKVIALKVANLCAHNPMEWEEFVTRTPARHDVDFKWLYRLMQPNSGTYKQLLLGAEFPFPRATAAGTAGLEDCMGGSTGGGGFPP